MTDTELHTRITDALDALAGPASRTDPPAIGDLGTARHLRVAPRRSSWRLIPAACLLVAAVAAVVVWRVTQPNHSVRSSDTVPSTPSTASTTSSDSTTTTTTATTTSSSTTAPVGQAVTISLHDDDATLPTGQPWASLDGYDTKIAAVAPDGSVVIASATGNLRELFRLQRGRAPLDLHVQVGPDTDLAITRTGVLFVLERDANQATLTQYSPASGGAFEEADSASSGTVGVCTLSIGVDEVGCSDGIQSSVAPSVLGDRVIADLSMSHVQLLSASGVEREWSPTADLAHPIGCDDSCRPTLQPGPDGSVVFAAHVSGGPSSWAAFVLDSRPATPSAWLDPSFTPLGLATTSLVGVVADGSSRGLADIDLSALLSRSVASKTPPGKEVPLTPVAALTPDEPLVVQPGSVHSLQMEGDGTITVFVGAGAQGPHLIQYRCVQAPASGGFACTPQWTWAQPDVVSSVVGTGAEQKDVWVWTNVPSQAAYVAWQSATPAASLWQTPLDGTSAFTVSPDESTSGALVVYAADGTELARYAPSHPPKPLPDPFADDVAPLNSDAAVQLVNQVNAQLKTCVESGTWDACVAQADEMLQQRYASLSTAPTDATATTVVSSTSFASPPST